MNNSTERVGPNGEDSSPEIRFDTTTATENSVVWMDFNYDNGRFSGRKTIYNGDTVDKIICTRHLGVGSVTEFERELGIDNSIPSNMHAHLENIAKNYPPKCGYNESFETRIFEDDSYIVYLDTNYMDEPYAIVAGPEVKDRLKHPEMIEFLKSYGLTPEYIEEVVDKTYFDIALSDHYGFGSKGFDNDEFVPQNKLSYLGNDNKEILICWRPKDDAYIAAIKNKDGGIPEILHDGEPVIGIKEIGKLVEPYGNLPKYFEIMVSQLNRNHAEKLQQLANPEMEIPIRAFGR